MGKDNGGLDLEGVGDVLGIVGGAATGAAQAIDGQSPASILAGQAFGGLTLDLGTILLGGAAGFFIAKQQHASPAVGAIGGAVGAVVLRSVLGV